MCIPFFHKYRIVGGWHGHNLFGGVGTCIEKVCKNCGHYATQIEPGYIDIQKLITNSKEK